MESESNEQKSEIDRFIRLFVSRVFVNIRIPNKRISSKLFQYNFTLLASQ